MTGLPEFNFPAFFAAERYLKSAGHECFNPARNDAEKYGLDVSGARGSLDEIPEFHLRKALSDDTQYLCHQAEGIYMLQGWESSPGACAEHALAKALGLRLFYQSTV